MLRVTGETFFQLSERLENQGFLLLYNVRDKGDGGMTPLPFCRYRIVRQRDPKKRGKEIIKLYNNPLFGRFSISPEKLIRFGLTICTGLDLISDNGRNEMPGQFQKAFFLIAECRISRQSGKP